MDTSLRLELKRVEGQLSGKWKKEYQKVKKHLNRDLEENEEYYQVCLGLATLFLQSQQDNKEPNTVYGEDMDHFYVNLLAQCETYKVHTRDKRRKIDLLLNGWMVGICIVAMLYMRYYGTSYYHIEREGFAYLPFATDYEQTHEDYTQEIAFEIDLNDLTQNTNKVILESEGCTIVLTQVEKENGNYLLTFKSTGVIEESDATLITAEKHYSDENGHRYFDMSATLSFECNGTVYYGVCADMNSLDKEGDTYSYELFSAKDYVNGEFKELSYLQDNSIVSCKLNGLLVYNWHK